MIGDNLNEVRREASRLFRSKKREYLEDRINELTTNSKNKLNLGCLHPVARVISYDIGFIIPSTQL
jgi:hypothetical protein